MKTIGILILIPIIFAMEIAIFLCSFAIYGIFIDGNFYTGKLIDKL